jgi:hypothetical protein
MRRTAFVALAILLLSTIPAAAGDGPRAGDWVVTRFGTVLKVGKQEEAISLWGRSAAGACEDDLARLALDRDGRPLGLAPPQEARSTGRK